MAVITIDEKKVAAVNVIEKVTYPTSVVVKAGQAVQFDTTTGLLKLAKATTAPLSANLYIALSSVGVGQAVTVIKQGLLNLGTAMDTLAFGASVYLNDADGSLGDAPGTVSVLVGKVVPAFGSGMNVDRLLRVDIAG